MESYKNSEIKGLVLFVSPFEDVGPVFPFLKKSGIEIAHTQDITEAINIIRKRQPLASFIREDTGLYSIDTLFSAIQGINPYPLIVVYAKEGDAVRAEKYMNLGAWDFWLLPLSRDKIKVIIDSRIKEISEQATRHRDNNLTISTSCPPVQIVGKDKKIRFALSLAKKVAPSNATVLIMGESGTGKELIARYIHIHSPRASSPFIAINCAALPENLLESELFGFEKGAFTGAYRTKPGKFELAQGGTLLLDEITEMDLPLQAKLLRVIQEREVDRLGGTNPIKIDVRILATTNREIKEYVNEGKFREDLYYRLNVIPILLPPLRERGEDILILAQYFLKYYAREYNITLPSISEGAKRWLLDHPWPGNIRELQNLMERAILLSQGETIQVKHFLIESLMEEENVDEEPPIEDAIQRDTQLQQNPERDIVIEGNRIIPLEEIEKIMIVKSLKRTGGNRTRAAELLGISVRTLRNKLNRLREEGIEL